MRHRHGLRKLNRTSSHRLAMLRNMTNSLFKHELIKTTLPKAKELRRVAETADHAGQERHTGQPPASPSIGRATRTSSTSSSTSSARATPSGPGGYLRILKFGFRQGDNAPMALVELVDRPEPAAEAGTETKAAA